MTKLSDPTWRAKYIKPLSGKDFITYPGLLDLAHDRGLCAIKTRIIQIPTAENNDMAICTARVVLRDPATGAKQVYTGVGDAGKHHVAPAMQASILRLAETRAKARALRDAVNVAEEIDDDSVVAQADRIPDSSRAQTARTRPATQPAAANTATPAQKAPAAKTEKAETPKKALTPEQEEKKRLYHTLCEQEEFGVHPDDISGALLRLEELLGREMPTDIKAVTIADYEEAATELMARYQIIPQWQKHVSSAWGRELSDGDQLTLLKRLGAIPKETRSLGRVNAKQYAEGLNALPAYLNAERAKVAQQKAGGA